MGKKVDTKLALFKLKTSANFRLFRIGSIPKWIGLMRWSVYNTTQCLCTIGAKLYINFINRAWYLTFCSESWLVISLGGGWMLTSQMNCNRRNVFRVGEWGCYFIEKSNLISKHPLELSCIEVVINKIQSICEKLHLGLNELNDGTDRQKVPLQNEDHPGNEPSLFSCFPLFCSGMFLERFRGASISVGSRDSSSLDSAPKMWDSFLLNYWDSFLLTLPSMSSKTCVISSSLIQGTDVFRHWPFLGIASCFSPATAANFRLFLNFAIFWKTKKLLSFAKTDHFLLVNQLEIMTKTVIL